MTSSNICICVSIIPTKFSAVLHLDPILSRKVFKVLVVLNDKFRLPYLCKATARNMHKLSLYGLPSESFVNNWIIGFFTNCCGNVPSMHPIGMSSKRYTKKVTLVIVKNRHFVFGRCLIALSKYDSPSIRSFRNPVCLTQLLQRRTQGCYWRHKNI